MSVPAEHWTPFPAEAAARYREAGLWDGTTLDVPLRDGARAHPEREAAVGPTGRLTYAELDARADALAAGLHGLGVRPGERVVVQLPNDLAFLEVVLGCFRHGALPVFALPAHREHELVHVARAAEAVGLVTAERIAGTDHRALARAVAARVPTLRHVVVDGDAEELVPLGQLRAAPREHAPVDPGGLAFLQLSGGSTGLPKLIPRTHDDYGYSVRESAVICGLDAASTYLAALPVAHNYPLSSPGVLGALAGGSRIVLAPAPSPDACFPLIEAERVSVCGLVPPLALVWVQAAERTEHDLSSLELLQVGGARCPPELARRIGPALGCRVQQVFGMAEGLVNYTRADDPEDVVVHTQGRPISALDEVRVVDDHDEPVPDGVTGHLQTRGPYTIRGYWRGRELGHDAAAFCDDGSYRTGDLVRITPEGGLVVEGRAKDQINRGGEKVPIEEIEDLLLEQGAVHDAVLVGLPDEVLGERTCAVVVPAAGADRPDARTVRGWLRERGVAAFKLPDRVEVLDALPETGVGKVSRADLREELRRRLLPAAAPEAAPPDPEAAPPDPEGSAAPHAGSAAPAAAPSSPDPGGPR